VARAERLSELRAPAALVQARAQLEQAAALEPDSAELWLAWGRMARRAPALLDSDLPAAEAGDPGGALSAAAPAERALRYLERALELDPGNPEVLLELSRHLYTMGEHQRAGALVERLLQHQPDHVEALLRQGEALVALRQPVEAQAVLERCIELAREDGDLLTVFQAQGALGQAYAQQGRRDEAEAYLLQAAAELDLHRAAHPGRTTVNCPHESLARLYQHSGRREQAAVHAVRAADLRAWIPRLQYVAAGALLEQGDLEGARVYLDRGLARDDRPASDPLREDLERRLEEAGLPATGADGTLAAAARLADLYRFDLAATRLEGWDGLGDCDDCGALLGFFALLGGEPAAARARFEAVLARQPGHVGALVGMGHLAVEEKRYDAATATFAQALGRLDPAAAVAGEEMDWMVAKMALLGAAWCHQAQGSSEQASLAFARLLVHRPDDVQALLGQGNALNGLGQPALAQEHFQRVLFLAPDHPQALAGLGTALLNQGEHELAAAVFRGAQAVATPGYSCPFEGLGLVYLAQGKSGDAREQFQLAISADPHSDYRKYDELARFHIEAGELEEAERLLHRSLDNFPQGEQARALLAEIRGAQAPPDPPP